MKRVETTPETVVEEIRGFYDVDVWHYVGMNGVDLDDRTVEAQWIFKHYEGAHEAVMFFCQVPNDSTLPSISPVIDSAWATEGEFVDLFGVKIDGIPQGFFMDSDSDAPLRERP